VTIRVTEDLRDRLTAMHEKDYAAIPFNAFLGYLVEKGADEEDFIAEYRREREALRQARPEERVALLRMPDPSAPRPA